MKDLPTLEKVLFVIGSVIIIIMGLALVYTVCTQTY